MYHFQWQWTYTVISLCSLVALFAIAGAVLLLRRLSPGRRWHRSPQSIATPYGYIPWWDVDTQHLFAQGVERARNRQYYVRGRE